MASTKRDINQENNWRDETSFSTQLEYIEYIRAKPFAVQLLMAKANLPVAQRLIATHYVDQKDMKRYLFRISESAKNNDPIALLMFANHHLQTNNIDEAIPLADKAIQVKESLKDQDFIQNINGILGDVFLNIGAFCAQSKKLDKAKEAWERAVTFNCYASALNLAQMNIQTKNLKDALFYTELALYFSHDIPDEEKETRNTFRSESHCLRGIIKLEQAGEQISYAELLDIVSELQKSIAYKKGERNTDVLKDILSSIDSEELKADLISNSTTLAFENGTYKTCDEFFKSAGKTKEEVAEWIQYQDPRIAKTNTSSSTPISDEVDPIASLLKKLGLFPSGSSSSVPPSEDEDNDETKKHSMRK